MLPKFGTDGSAFKGSYIIYITRLYIKQMVHGRGIKELKMRVMRAVRYVSYIEGRRRQRRFQRLRAIIINF